MSSPPSPLDYAPRPPAHQRRMFWRLSIATVVLAFVVSGWWWAPPEWRNLRLLYWQRKCMIYDPPTGQVVYDSKQQTRLIPAEWSSFYGLCSPPGFRSDGTIFMHQLTRPDGVRRLVVTDFTIAQQFSGSDRCIFTRVLSPGTLMSVPRELSGKFLLIGLARNGERYLRIQCGSLDPADPTHFTFHVIQFGTGSSSESIYDAWLQNDDSVAIGERKSPLAPK